MPRKNNNWSKNMNLEEIVRLREQGIMLKEIEKITGIPAKTLSDTLIRRGYRFPRSRRYWVNDTFFDVIDCEIKAYLLGYFIADGCCCFENKKHNGVIDSHAHRLTLSVSEDDEEVIKLFQKYISPDRTIEHTNIQNGVKYKRKPQLRYRWSSTHMFNVFKDKYKILSRKTYDSSFVFPFDTIPNDLHRHFIRGYFDGDGCKPTNINSINFCFNSKSFAEQICKVFPYGHHIAECKGKTCVYYKVKINGGKKLIEWVKDYFYKDANYYLKRKFNKF